MTLSLEKVSKEDWALISKGAHGYSFGVDRDPSFDRISYALIVKKDDELAAFCTVIEIDGESAYMQHGGNFKPIEGTTLTLRAYMMFVNYLAENYKIVSTRVWNKNKAMLKISWAAGFVVVGCEISKAGDLYLNLDLDR